MAKFVIRLGVGVVGEYSLLKPVVTIGRKDDNDLRVDNLSVSNHHARVVKDGDRFAIEDVGSTNGTYVHNRRIKRHRLSDGDEIRLGKYTLVFLADARRAEVSDQKTVRMTRPTPIATPAPAARRKEPTEPEWKTNGVLLAVAIVLFMLILTAIGIWLVGLG
jgi:pSer/pThr/pTyr-binding forkhead associated (FHA) protein